VACTHAKEPPTTATSERLGTASSRPLTVSHRPLNSRCPGAYPVDVGENFPLMWQFCTSYTGGVFRSLSARTSPGNWSSKSKTPAGLPDETGKNPALQEASYTEDTGGGSVQHAAIALIRPRRQQHLRLPAITCDTHCKVYNRTTPVFANYKVSCLNYK